MELKDKIQFINNSSNLHDAVSVLPSPSSKDNYYAVYYSKDNYKLALTDILQFSVANMNILYNTYDEFDDEFDEYFIESVVDCHCLGVMIYLDEQAYKDDNFYKLCLEIKKNRLNYFSVNSPDEETNKFYSGEQMITYFDLKLNEDQKLLYGELFANEITYLNATASIEEKLEKLKSFSERDILIYSYDDASLEATVCGVRDLLLEEAVIPRQVLHNEKTYTVTKLGALAFKNCGLLNEIHFPDTLKEIGANFSEDAMDEKTLTYSGLYDAIDGCNLGVWRYRENLIRGITGYTFYGCHSLKKLDFPSSVEWVHSYTFFQCPTLERVSLPGVKYCYTNAFVEFYDDSCNIKELELSDYFYYTQELNICQKSNYTRINLPKSIKSIKGCDLLEIKDKLIVPPESYGLNGLVKGNKSLTYIELPKSLRKLLVDEFVGCDNLKEIVFTNEKYDFDSHDGVFESPLSECKNLEILRLPKKQEQIRFDMFSKCTKLKELELPVDLDYISLAGSQYEDSLGFLSVEEDCSAFNIKKRDKEMIATLEMQMMLARRKMNALSIQTIISNSAKSLSERNVKVFNLVPAIKEIYLIDKEPHVEINGFKIVESDRVGYHKYVKN